MAGEDDFSRRERLQDEVLGSIAVSGQATGSPETLRTTVMRFVDTNVLLDRVSYWDATIIEAARLQQCEVLLSEDLSHGQDFDGVRVENPFLESF